LASTAVGGTYVGPGLLHRDGSVVVSDWPTDSLLRGSRVVPGSVILGVNGAPYVSSTGTGTYTPARDLAFGDVIEYRTPQGTVERTTLTSVAAPTPLPTPAPVSVSPNVEVRYDVRLLGVRALEVSASYFRPEVRIETAQAGDYRLVDSRGAAISPWSGLGAGSTADLIGGAVPRAAGDAYELFVERRRGDEIRRYQAAFQLSGAGN
jgi:hypothetical protein